MRWKKALNIIQAAYLVTGLEDREFEMKHYIDEVEGEVDLIKFQSHVFKGRIIAGWDEDFTIPKMEESEEIYKALYEDACHEIEAFEYVNNSEGLIQSLGTKSLEIFQPVKIYSETTKNSKVSPQLTTFTKQSLANWFYEAGDTEKARVLVPNLKEGINSHDKEPSPLENENGTKQLKIEPTRQEITTEEIQPNHYSYVSGLPELTQCAIDVYENCWEALPEDMTYPKKPELIEYIQKRHRILEKSAINSIIKLSIPDNITLGGHPKKDQLTPWRKKNDR